MEPCFGFRVRLHTRVHSSGGAWGGRELRMKLLLHSQRSRVPDPRGAQCGGNQMRADRRTRRARREQSASGDTCTIPCPSTFHTIFTSNRSTNNSVASTASYGPSFYASSTTIDPTIDPTSTGRTTAAVATSARRLHTASRRATRSAPAPTATTAARATRRTKETLNSSVSVSEETLNGEFFKVKSFRVAFGPHIYNLPVNCGQAGVTPVVSHAEVRSQGLSRAMMIRRR